MSLSRYYFINGDAISSNRVSHKINSFAGLRPGWRYGSGRGFSRATRNHAMRLAYQSFLSGFQNVDAFPGKEGDITVACYDGNDQYAFKISEDGQVRFVHEQNDNEMTCKEGLSITEALLKIQELTNAPWTSHYSFISATTTDTWEDFEAKHSRIPATEAEYQLSEMIA
jgi:hypothetical protein